MDAFIHVGLDLQRICVDWDMLIIYWAIEHNNIFQKVLPLRLLGCLTLCTKVPFCSTLPLSLSLFIFTPVIVLPNIPCAVTQSTVIFSVLMWSSLLVWWLLCCLATPIHRK